jgi:hypothetical protein
MQGELGSTLAYSQGNSREQACPYPCSSTTLGRLRASQDKASHGAKAFEVLGGCMTVGNKFQARATIPYRYLP